MTFIPDLSILVQFAIASVILAITPGPDMTLFVSRTLSQGRATGFASMSGALFGTLVHTTLVVVGIFSYFTLGVDLFPKVDIPTVVVNGANVEEVHDAAKKAVEHVRSGKGPIFLQADLERWPGSHQVRVATSVTWDGPPQQRWWGPS